MDILFFVIFPIVTILIAIVLQKLLRNPLLVAILTFAVFLILAYTVFTPEFVLNAIIYAILAYITAYIVRLICCLRRKIDCNDHNDDNNLEEVIAGLEDSIDSLEDNVNNLTDLISTILNNSSGCSCNRRIGR